MGIFTVFMVALSGSVAHAGIEVEAAAGLAQDVRGTSRPAGLATAWVRSGPIQLTTFAGEMALEAGAIELGLHAEQPRFAVAGGLGAAGVVGAQIPGAAAFGAWLELGGPVFFFWRTFEDAILTWRFNVFTGGPGTLGMGAQGNRAAVLNAHARLYARVAPRVHIFAASDTVTVNYIRDARAHAVSLGLRLDLFADPP